MKRYNRIMELFWLFASIAIVLVVTFMGVKEGFSKWYFYYISSAMTFGTFFMRRYMRRRMERYEAEIQSPKK